MICLANKARQGSSRLAKEASDGVAAEPSASTAQIQEDNRQIVALPVLHEGTRDPRHRPFERRRRPCRYVARGGLNYRTNNAQGRNIRVAKEASDDGTAAGRVPAARNREDNRQIANARA